MKAFLRLTDKLKKQYPRLPVCILADGLDPSETAFDICEGNGWKYIFVLQDKSLKSVQEELVLPRRAKAQKEHYCLKDGWRISRELRFETAIAYHKKYELNWFQCLETRKKDIPQGKTSPIEVQHSRFEYLTNIEPTRENIIRLALGGRLRWKVENEGFNAQKCGDYELEHKYCRNSYTGLKNSYSLLQIAHAINQLVEKSKAETALLTRHAKETIRNLWNNLTSYMLFVPTGENSPPADGNPQQPHPS
jgi:hypothetical protein